MTFRVGSAAWLLHHELRLAWRSVRKGDPLIGLLIAVPGWLLLHLVAWFVLRIVNLRALAPPVALLFGAAAWLAVTLMLAQAMLLSVTALFDRGDFDLLLSSPLPARTVFFVRSLGIAATCTLFYLFVLSPFANLGPFTGQANLLAIYPAVLSLGLLVSSIGMLCTLTLVRWLGARRARTVAQVAGAVIGGAFFLLIQAGNLLGTDTRRRIGAAFEQWSASAGPLAPESPVWLPFQAALGKPLALLVLVLTGAGGFWLVTTLAQRRFLAGTQAVVAGRARAARPTAQRVRFHAGLVRNMLIKEWKLIARDPTLIANTLLQVLYMAPLAVFLFRGERLQVGGTTGVVLLAGVLAGNLAWITVSAEDAPELIASSPVPAGRVRYTKALAALLPVWLLVSPVLVAVLWRSVTDALVFAFCVAGSTGSSGMTQIWYPRQGDRKNIQKRARGSMAIAYLEMFSQLGWAGVTYCVIAAPRFTPIAVGFALLGPAAVWLMGRERRAQQRPV